MIIMYTYILIYSSPDATNLDSHCYMQRSTVKAANKKFISFVSFETITFIYRAFQV